VDATAALAKGAQQQGAKLFQGVSVDAVLDDGLGRVTGVRTSDGHVIQSEFVVNCAGMWARQLAEKSRVILPNQAAQHSYLITDTIEGVDPNWPVREYKHVYIQTCCFSAALTSLLAKISHQGYHRYIQYMLVLSS